MLNLKIQFKMLSFLNRFLFGLALIFTLNLEAQIQKKIEYQYESTPQKVFAWQLFSVLSQSNPTAETFKIRGIDDSLKGENLFSFVLSDTSIVIYDIESIDLINDSTMSLLGTWWQVSYDLTPREAKKKIIIRKINDQEYEIIKVRRDIEGKAYIKKWHRNSELILHDSQIVSINIKNYDTWVNDENEKQKGANRSRSNNNLMGITIGAIASGILLFLYPLIK